MKDCIYTLHGEEVQHVIVRIKPKESIIGDISTMVCMDKNIAINHSYHDLFIKILDDKFEWVHFNNINDKEATIILSPKNTGKVVELSLDQNIHIIVNRQTFMCCHSDLSFKNSDETWLRSYMDVSSNKKNRWMLLHSKGKAIKKELKKDEKLIVNTSCVMAFSNSMTYKSINENDSSYGLVSGPGSIWMQTTTTKGSKNYVVLDESNRKDGELAGWMDLAKMFDED